MAEAKRAKVTSPQGVEYDVKAESVERYLAAGFTSKEAKKAVNEDREEARADRKTAREATKPPREASAEEQSDSAVQAVTRKGNKS